MKLPDLTLLQRLLPYAMDLLDRARVSRWTRLLAWTAAGGLVVATVVIGEEWLLSQAHEESDRHTAQRILDGRITLLQLAYDTIGNCIKARESSAESLAQQKSYCDDATERYQRTFEDWPANHVDEVIQKDLFLAMQSEVAHYIRMLESDRRMQLLDSPARDQVRLVLSVKGLAVSGAVIVLFLGFVAHRLWWPRQPVDWRLRPVARRVAGARAGACR